MNLLQQVYDKNRYKNIRKFSLVLSTVNKPKNDKKVKA